MARLLHYINEDTDDEYIVIDDDSGEDWSEESYKLESDTDIGDVPVTLPSNRILKA